MRKLIVEEWQSADGFFTDAKGGTSFFPDPEGSSVFDRNQSKFLESVDTLLMGRKTYELFSSYWPNAGDTEVIAGQLNALQKYVVSNTLRRAPWDGFADAEILSGSVLPAIREIKQQPGGDLVVWGSLSLVGALLEAGMVDIIRLHTCAVANGNGRRLFPEAWFKPLHLAGYQAYMNGVTSAYYALA